MTRRALLLLPIAAALRADSAQEVWDLFVSMASALSESNPVGFLDAFDPAMPGYEDLRRNVTALTREASLQSSVEFLRNEGNDRRRTVELDWALDIVDRQNTAASRHREQNLTCRLEKTGRKWRIVALEPLSFFEPPPV